MFEQMMYDKYRYETTVSDGSIIITYICMECGEEATVKVDQDKFFRWQRGEYIQDVWPELSPEERDEIKIPLHAKCSEDFYAFD